MEGRSKKNVQLATRIACSLPAFTNVRGHVGVQMENKTLKEGNDCDRGWEINHKHPNSTNLIQKKIEIWIIPGTE